MKMESFGIQLNRANIFLNHLADSILSLTNDPERQISLALEAIRTQVGWNEVADLIPEDYLKKVWDQGTGTSSDMNFILLSLLKKLKINSAPLILSTRKSGRIIPYFPTVNKFNYVICYIEAGDKVYVVDVSDKYSPLGMLPARCLNGGGFKLGEKTGEWIVLKPSQLAHRLHSITLAIDESGLIKGELIIRHSNYQSALFRSEFERVNTEDEYLENFEKKHGGVFILDYKTDIEDTCFGDVTEAFTLEMEDYCTSIGNLITFNPIFFNRKTENPFKLEERLYPVDFTVPIKEMSIFNIRIPEGYEIEQIPESMILKNQDASARFQYSIARNGQNIQLMMIFEIKKPMFIQTEYAELKILYNLMVQKQQEVIIIKKIT
jgi:hypothetical protein